jgi:predicted nucleotidyltransferase
VTVELAREVATRMGSLDGVVAVSLGGSLARGRADRRSDVDLGLYYDPARPFSVHRLRALATELDDRHAPEVVGFGAWGPWINGGAWTLVHGVKVDLLYRDLRLVDRVLDDYAAGRTTCAYQPGHPHGFHSHSYAGEVHHGLALHDPTGALAARRARTSPYPPALRRELMRRYLWEADFAVARPPGSPAPRPASPPPWTPPWAAWARNRPRWRRPSRPWPP